jgi:hypothetical protein
VLPWHAAALARRPEQVERALVNDRDLALQYDLVRETQRDHPLNELLGAVIALHGAVAAIEAEGVKAPVRRSFDFASRISEFMSGFRRAYARLVGLRCRSGDRGAGGRPDHRRDQGPGPGGFFEPASYRSIDDALVVIRSCRRRPR